MTQTFKQTAAFLGSLLLLAACGGGSSGTDRAGGGGASGATVRGAVQGTDGALVVNGVAFSTAGATLRDDDGATHALPDDSGGLLRDGMIVTVRGDVDDRGRGEAAEVEFHHLLEGAIEDVGPGYVVVSGVAISIDDDTRHFDDHGGAVAPGTHGTGDRVAVSGHADGRGGVRATFLAATDDSPEQEVTAWVVAVDGTVLSLAFEPGGAVSLRVDVGGIAGAPAFAAGDLVEVKTRGAADAAGIYTAVAIHAEDDLGPGGAGSRFELEGILTAIDAEGFTVAGQRVVTTASTRFEHGTIDDLVVGAKLEVEGALRDDGVLVATKVQLKPSVRIEANVEAVDAAAGTFRALGFDVRLTPATELRGLSGAGALAVGTRIQVRGTPTRDGLAIDALRAETLDDGDEDRAFLRGVVTAKTAPTSVSILGITIDASSAEFRDHADNALTASAFFDAITPGQTMVKVRWRPYPASTAAAADELELEDD